MANINKLILENICNEIIDLIIKKNLDYKNSFFETVDKFGLKSLAIRLYDKVNRLISISENSDYRILNESEKDTIFDIIGYSILYLYKIGEVE